MNTLLKLLMYTLLLVQMWGKVHWAVMLAIVILAVETEVARLSLAGILDILQTFIKTIHDHHSRYRPTDETSK